MSRSVLVVGGGVIGLCSAYELAKRGHRVTVVDPGSEISTSTINAGMIVPSHVIPLAAPGMIGFGLKMLFRPRSPFWIRPRLDGELFRWGKLFARNCTREHVDRASVLLRDLHIASRDGYLDFERELPGFKVTKKGLLMICKDPKTLEKERHEAEFACQLGLHAKVLDRAALNELETGIEVDAAGAIHHLDDCHFSPGQFMSALSGRLDELGVRRIQERVTGFHASGRTVDSAVTASGELVADEFILAAGAWSDRLAKGLGIDLPLQAGKGYSFDVAAPQRCPTVCAILVEARVAVTPMGPIIRFGGTMEIGPADNRISRGRVQAIRAAVPSYYPGFAHVDVQSPPASVGLRPCSPDGLPYLGRSGRHDNFVIATGHAMMGMSLGPITGRLVGEIVSGLQPQIDLSALSPHRFSPQLSQER